MTKIAAPAAVLFDCDGVLVDSETPVFELLMADLARYGLVLDMAALERDYMGRTLAQIAVQARIAGAALPEDWEAQTHAGLNNLLRAGVPLFEGVLAVLDTLDAAQIPYAIGSNGARAKMDITLGERGLLSRFRGVFSGEEMGRPKPLPDIYLAGAAACGVDPVDCVVIEDSPTGARAALAAGMRCLGFAPHGEETTPAQALRALNVPLFHHMSDLPALLGLDPA